MKKFNIARKPIVLLGLAVVFISLITVTVFAAYTFSKNVVDEDVTVGDVTVDSKSYLSYAKYSDSDITGTLGYEANSTNYYVAKKMRVDTVCLLEDIQMKASYTQVSISSFESGVTYYTHNSENDSYTVASSYDSSETYYTASYVLNSVKNAYDITVNRLTTEINDNQITVYEYGSTTTTLAILTVTVDSDNGVLTKVTSVVESSTVEGTLKAIIGSDSLSITIIDSSLITSNNTSSEISTTSNKVTCYANYRNRDDSRIDYSLPYLSQLGLEFTFTAKIPVYVRIHIQDAWISERIISSTRSRTRYVLKDQISGSSPFAVSDDDWYYDSATNIVYLMTLYTPTYTVDTDGSYVYDPMSVTFNVNEGYYYYDTSPTAASTYTTVEVSFTVDIVQANRAAALWGSDFTKIFG